jgi:mono/diheme cytochrome c family protein
MKFRTWLIAGAFVGLWLAALPASSAEIDGKKVFLDQKCNMCHAVTSADIEQTGKVKAPDLAGAAAKHDAATLTKFLRKQEMIKNKKHIKPFTGTDDELAALVAWLQKQDQSDKKK